MIATLPDRHRRGVGDAATVPLNTIVPVNSPCPAGSKATVFTGATPNVQMCIQPCAAGGLHNPYVPATENSDGSFTALPFGTALDVWCWTPQTCTFTENGQSYQGVTDIPEHEGEIGPCSPPMCPAMPGTPANCPPGQISQPISGDYCGGTQCVPSNTPVTSTTSGGTTLGFPTWAVIAAAGAAVLLFMRES